LRWRVTSGLKRIPLNEDSRMLSYLPLSHVVERALVEHGQLATGMHVYFAESLETFTADLQRARPTVFFSVPRLWVKFQQGISAKMPPRSWTACSRSRSWAASCARRCSPRWACRTASFAAGGAAPMPPELLRWYGRWAWTWPRSTA
jgi:long-chain acyl-CoA synthetase